MSPFERKLAAVLIGVIVASTLAVSIASGPITGMMYDVPRDAKVPVAPVNSSSIAGKYGSQWGGTTQLMIRTDGTFSLRGATHIDGVWRTRTYSSFADATWDEHWREVSDAPPEMIEFRPFIASVRPREGSGLTPLRTLPIMECGGEICFPRGIYAGEFRRVP